MIPEHKLTEVTDMSGQIWQCDVRVGCVAVYSGPKRECLSFIQDNPACVFYKHGVWTRGTKDTGGHWTVHLDDRRHGVMIAGLLNALERIAEGECNENHPPETCNCASLIARSGLTLATKSKDQS